ncbi:RtcB family protein, partial [Nonomuraea sp. NPDC047529]|uniref:RtcB family protein n=1 Tax=Nonomuraea sp. NPDC047529 TaxID=3155623 RepID=UPI0033C36623
LVRLVLTPDFHKGAGIPIGTVIETEGALLPQTVGNDVNCGMRLEVTSLTVEQVRPRLDALERRLLRPPCRARRMVRSSPRSAPLVDHVRAERTPRADVTTRVLATAQPFCSASHPLRRPRRRS